MDKDTIKQAVRDYVLQEFLRGEAPDSLEDSTPLISGGILDSIGTIKLVSFLEGEFDVEFQAHEVSHEYLDTLTTITDTVHGKLAAK